MKGTAGLRDLEVQCVIGVYDHERIGPQPLHNDVELDYDFAAAAASDQLADAVDYDGVTRTITRLAEQRGYQLLETLAEEAVSRLFHELPTVQTIRMEIRKPRAVAAAAASFVRVERERP